MAQTILERIEAPGPKKIHTCDGGGILGPMSVEILAKIEAELRTKTGKPGLVLAIGSTLPAARARAPRRGRGPICRPPTCGCSNTPKACHLR